MRSNKFNRYGCVKRRVSGEIIKKISETWIDGFWARGRLKRVSQDL